MKLWIYTDTQAVETQEFNAMLLNEKDIKLIKRIAIPPTSLSDRSKQLQEKEVCMIHFNDEDDAYQVFYEINFTFKWDKKINQLDLSDYGETVILNVVYDYE